MLLISFGSLLAMGLPIGTALLGLGTGFGLIELLSRVLSMPDFASQIALMIGLGVGVDYALFIVTRYREAYRLRIGDELEMIGHQPFDGPCGIRIGNRRHDLGLKLARAIRIERASE